jgi:hypothetical protein
LVRKEPDPSMRPPDEEHLDVLGEEEEEDSMIVPT